MNGAGVHDTLLGITSVAALGTGDTLIGGPGSSTLVSNAGGNTLVAGAGTTEGDYFLDDVTVDLASGVAAVNGTSTADTLIGLHDVAVSGHSDTLIGGAVADVLSSSGVSNTLIAGTGTETLVSSGSNDTLLAASGSDILSSSGNGNTLIAGSGLATLSSSGTGDTLIGGSSGLLTSSGHGNTLIAGSGAVTLSSSGHDDLLVGNATGSVLDGTSGVGTIAVYTLDDVTVDLATGTASVNGSSQADTLVGIDAVAALGSGDTIIGGPGFTTLLGNGSGNTLVAGSGDTQAIYTLDGMAINLAAGTATVEGATVNDVLIGINDAMVTGTSDTLIGGAGPEALSAAGSDDTIIAGTGVQTLSSSGSDNTLVGNGAGSILDGTGGTGTIAAYALDNVTVDLAAGTATVNGSSVSDTLRGITSVMLSGHNDTAIGGTIATTLYSDGAGNTLVAGAGQTTAAYALDNVTIDLATSSATVLGSSTSDTLVGIAIALVSGNDDIAIGSGGGDILSSSGTSNTLVAGSGVETLSSSGFGDTLLAGNGHDTLSSSGQGNVLIAGAVTDVLSSSGVADTLIGNAAGSTLIGTGGTGAVAAYTLNAVTVDLSAGIATVNGSGVSDTLVGISSAAALGTGDTLIGGAGAGTLIGDAANGTLIAGSGQTVARYDLDDIVVNLVAGTATVVGSSTSDTLVGFRAAAVSGANDTLIGNVAGNLQTADGQNDVVLGGSGAETLLSSGLSNTLYAGGGSSTLASSGFGDTLVAGGGSDILLSSGEGNVLIAGSGADTLISSGSDDTLYGNAGGSTLDGSGGIDAVAAYALADAVVDLAGGTATGGGSSLSDRLIGIDAATVSGSNDTLLGNSGSDILGASGSDDLVVAGSGTDTLIMNSGTNTFLAGAGVDTFIVQSAVVVSGLDQPQNLIGNFDTTRDVVDLTNISGVGSFADLSFATVTFNGQSYLQVTLGTTGEAITFSGLTAQDLSADNFVFAQASTTPSAPTITSEVLADDTGASQIDFVTSDGEVTLTGATASGSTVAIYDGSQDIGSATVSGTSWSFSTDLGAGTHQLMAVATNSGGTTASSAPAATIVVDDTTPQPIISGVSQGQGASLVLNGTSEANSSVQVLDGTTVLGVATASSSGAWSFTTGTLADTLHTFTVTASDLAGNVGSGSTVVQSGGSGIDTVNVSQTLQASNFAYDAADSVWQIAATGVSETLSGVEQFVDGAGHKFLLVGAGSQYATIQAAVDAASDGDTILIASGSYTENVDIAGKAISLEGFGSVTLHGSITEHGTLNGALSIDGMSIDATGQQYGVLVSASSTDFAGSVTLDHSSVANAELNGFAYIESGNGSTPTLTDTIGSISILNSGFSGNATQTSGANGRGDILLYGYNGNLTLDGVTIGDPGAGAQKAIQWRGVQTSANTTNVGPYQTGGNVSLANLNISGHYAQDLVAFYRIAAFNSFSASGVTLNASAPWGLLNFDEVGGAIDLSSGITATNLASRAPVAVEQGLSTNSVFIGTSGNDAFVGNGGNDTLIGGTGANTYLYSSSDGNDVVEDGSNQSELVFTDIASTGVTLSRPSGTNDLLITVAATGKTVRVGNEFGASGPGALQTISFDDGVSWSQSQVEQYDVPPTMTIADAPEPAISSAQTFSGSVVSGGTASVAGRVVTLSDNGTAIGTAPVQSNGSFSTSVTLPSATNSEIVASVSDSYGNTNQTYLAGPGSGQFAITPQDVPGSTNALDFTGSMTDQNLWFQQSGDNLVVDILGTTTSVTVNNWFAGSGNRLDEISAGSLHIDSQVSQLVQAMAVYSVNNPGFDPTSQSVAAVPNDPTLQSAVVSAWHS
ncbi:Ca2+-binding RTX toxin-like protein [Bradyrhizobium sp. USDA 4341]